MSAGHTLGPWFAVQPESANGWWVVSCNEDGSDCVDESGEAEFQANAHLIAAAPDLKTALADLLNHYVRLVECGDCGNWDAETEPEVIAARAAIARAIGAS